MSQQQLTPLIKKITSSHQFKEEVRKCCLEHKKKSEEDDRPTFAFEKENNYPWSFQDNSLPVQGQKAIEEMTEMLTNFIDGQLHNALSRQFMNISNQVLVIRQELTAFTREQEKQSVKLRHELSEQMQAFRKKVVVQQYTNNNNQGFFRRTRTTAINSSVSSTISQKQGQEAKGGDFAALKKQIDLLKQSFKKGQSGSQLSDQVSLLQEKMLFLEEKLQTEALQMRVKMEAFKQKQQRQMSNLAKKVGQNSSKEFISQEVRRSVKSHLKLYVDQIGKGKAERNELKELILRTDKGMQDYLANQLKPLWMLVQATKFKLQKIQEEFNMNNMSFVMQ